MATVNKDFKIKSGLIVEGTTGTINGEDILTKKQSDQDYIVGLIGGTSTSQNTPNSVVKRDGSGDFAAGEITADLVGNVTGQVSDISNHDTDDLSEGATNKYYTDSRVKNVLTGSTQTNITITEVAGELHITAENGVADSTTDDLAEGENNLYFTEQRAVDAVGGTRDNTPNTLLKRDGFGNAAIGQLDAESKFTAPDYRVGNAGQLHDNNGDLQLRAWDNNTLQLNADVDVRIEGQFINVNATDGNIDLYTTGAAYVNEDEILTRTASQEISNKTIAGTLVFGSANTNNAFIEGQYDANGDLTVNAGGTLNLVANTGDILVNPNGAAYYGGTSAENEIATHGYVDNAVAGLSWKQSVNLLWDDTTITMSGVTGTLALDGHPALTQANNGYRILTINMSEDSGIWVYSDDGSNWSISRATDSDTFGELVGAAVYVMEGTQYGSTSWVQGNHYITDFTGQSWTQFSGNGSVTAGNGIIVDGLQISIDTSVVATQTDLSNGLGDKQDTLTAGEGIYIDGDNIITGRQQSGGGLKFVFNEAAIDRNQVDGWYDQSGAASQALTDANYYTDGQLESYTPTSNLESTISGYGFAYNGDIPTSTDEISEGTFNHYYTDSRAKTAAADLLTAATKSNITITGDENGLTITAENGVADSTTDDLTEGENNLYFTQNRVIDAVDNQDITPKSVQIDTFRKEEATQTYFSAASTATVHSFGYPFGSVKYVVRVVGNAGGTLHSQITEILATVDGNNNVAVTEFGSIHTTEPALASFTVDYDAGTSQFRLRATTVNNGSEVIVAATLLSWAD